MIRKNFWTDKQDNDDYRAAATWLKFLFPPEAAADMVARMRSAPISYHTAATLLRVSMLPELPENNIHVIQELDKLHQGGMLPPVLLVSSENGNRAFFNLADGYYRICASAYIDRLVDIPCRMVPPKPPKAPTPEPAKPADDQVFQRPARLPRH